MNLNDLNSAGCLSTPQSERCDATLPDNPQCTINVHFGMLMGVDEFRTEQGFHLGRSRRHQRLLHGVGVVAGYAVSLDATTFDLRVSPGLAIDALGRDLVLEQDQCVNLVQWWLKHQQDEAFDSIKTPLDATFDLDVSVGYSTCLSSPVPAIAEPCAGNAADIAYARVCETVSLQLVRRTSEAPTPGTTPDAALRPCISRGSLALAQAAWPVAAPDPVQSSELRLSVVCLRGLHLRQTGGLWQVSVASIDYSVRPLLLSTAALQHLLLPQLAGQIGSTLGPRVQASSADQDEITLRFDQPLAAASVQPAAFAVSEFDTATGWQLFTVQSSSYTEPAGQAPQVRLKLDRAVAAKLLRVTVMGTGSTPVLSQSLLPAGALHANGDGRTLTTTIHRG
jgi:hypothetical protein